MTEHAPGPWKATRRVIRMPHGEAGHIEYTLTEDKKTFPRLLICHLKMGYGRKMDDANAHLIAASPEMKKELQEGFLPGDNGFANDLRDVANALANNHFGATADALLKKADQIEAAVAKAQAGGER